MGLPIGDNFSYFGKKFLDARKSFDTLEQMHACNDVPKGFITICYEDDKRYEYNGTAWVEYVVDSGSSSIDINDIVYYGPETPTNDDVIWFCSDDMTYAPITPTNPFIAELMGVIASMQAQITKLQEDVEYLKIHGGGGGTVNPNPTPTTYSYLVLEDGSKLLLETGENILLEEQEVTPTAYSYMTLEDGTKLLLETGECILLEEQETIITSSNVLLEDGSKVLLENGEKLLLEV